MADAGPAGATSSGAGGTFPSGYLELDPFDAPPLVDPAGAAPSRAEFEAFADTQRLDAGGVCVFEPPLAADGPGALYPRNFIAPRFRWQSATEAVLWEIRLSRASGRGPALRGYTRNTDWLLPTEIWLRLAQQVTEPVQVTVRGLTAAGALVGARGNFEIAPVDAGNSLVYLALETSRVTSQQPTRLVQLYLGDSTATELLLPAGVQAADLPGADGALPRGANACGDPPRPSCEQQPNDPACCDVSGFTPGRAQCIGCHVLTPDGKAVSFSDYDSASEWNASVEPGLVGAFPTSVTTYAASLLKQPWLGMAAFSPAHFSAIDRVLLTTYGLRPDPASLAYDPTAPARFGLAWFDLNSDSQAQPIPDAVPPLGETEAALQLRDQRNQAIGAVFGTAWGLLALDSEAASASSPAWSHDGEQIAYVSTDVSTTAGAPAWTANVADVRVVPYANRAGGPVFPLPGASDPNFLEYAPAYSADDAYLAFTRAPAPSVPVRCTPAQDASGIASACPQQELGDNPDGPYYNRNGEIFVVPRTGGMAIRLAANDPVACSGESSRGSINGGARWAPRVERANGKRYYFLAFTSARAYAASFTLPAARLSPPVSRKSSQLYLTAIIVDEATGNVETRPALYLWNQERVQDPVDSSSSYRQTSNMNPRWL